MKLFKKIIWTSLFLSLAALANAQGSGTPATLRVKIDANGYLLVSATAQTNPVTTSVFGQARLKTDASGNLLVVLTGGSSGAPANGPYITFTANSSLTNAQNVGLLSTGLLLNTVSAASGTISRYAGTSCTNQFPRSLNNSGAATCATVVSTDTDSSIAHTGTDINTSYQVTATHLASALPVNQGGTNATSASITAFNNITGLSAAGTTGTTSTNLVFSTSPTLVTPILGTPQSGTLTNATGLPEGGLSLTDITTNNVSTSQHGFTPKLDNNANHFLNGQGGYTTPAGGACSSTALSISSGFGTSPTLNATNGACAFKITIGSGGASGSGVLTMPTATTGWVCTASDITTPASNVMSTTATSTTSVTIQNYSRTTGIAQAWPASDVIIGACSQF